MFFFKNPIPFSGPHKKCNAGHMTSARCTGFFLLDYESRENVLRSKASHPICCNRWLHFKITFNTTRMF